MALFPFTSGLMLLHFMRKRKKVLYLFVILLHTFIYIVYCLNVSGTIFSKNLSLFVTNVCYLLHRNVYVQNVTNYIVYTVTFYGISFITKYPQKCGKQVKKKKKNEKHIQKSTCRATNLIF